MKRFGRLLALLCFCAMCGAMFHPITNAEASEMNWDTYSNTWGLTDTLGQSTPDIEETGPVRKDKYVLMFYHNWHEETTRSAVSLDKNAPRNVTRILSDYPDALENEKQWGPSETYHYWGEPIWGYYSLRTDDYVVRKHAQMLTDAGVDAIVLDYTNYLAGTEQIPYKKDLQNILNVFLEIQQEGGDVPQVVIMATWDYTQACKTVSYFYEQFYTDSRYDGLWFRWEGKPLFLAWDYMVSEEMKEYFTLRRPYPFDDANFTEREWPWKSAYPQKAAYTAENSREMVTVSVAHTISEYNLPMSTTDGNGNFIASGRSSTSFYKYLTSNPVSSEYHSEAGAAFQESFDHAISLDPSIVLITGWNEWIAARFTKAPEWSDVENVPPYGLFFDQFCAEFSRDIEPTRDGGLGDNFYNQLIRNIRRFKGTGTAELCSGESSIVIDGNFDDWEPVQPEYRDDLYDAAHRDSPGIGKNVRYVNQTGRNDFKTLKVAYDAEFVYFYAETTEGISPYTDPSWMNLLIKMPDTLPNWEGYQYIINRRGVQEHTTVLERSMGGYAWETVNDHITYAVSGCKLELAVPRIDLGIASNAEEILLDFKWHDNMQTAGDFLEFYLNGDSAPNSRFHYSFRSQSRHPSGSIPLVSVLLVLAASLLGSLGIGLGCYYWGRQKKKRRKSD